MPLFTQEDYKKTIKDPIKWLHLSCGSRESVKTDKYGSPIMDQAGRAITEIKKDLPRTYVLRFLPFLDVDEENLLYKATIDVHKLANGTSVNCTASMKGGCEYCSKCLPKISTHYSVVYLQATDANYSTGVYCLKYSGWLEKELLDFNKELVDQGIDLTSLLDDGCFISVDVSLNDSGFPRYKLSVTSDGSCPFTNEVRNYKDIVAFCKRREIPDLKGYVDSLMQKQLKKTYSFEDVESKFAKYEAEHKELIRSFDENAEDISQAFGIKTVDCKDEAPVETKPKSDEEMTEEESLAEIQKLFGLI